MPMPMSLQEISDRLEIQDLLVRYCHAIDTLDFDALDEVFTPDARIDYTEMGGASGTLPEIKAWLARVMPHFAGHQHMIANVALQIDGDTATGRTMCHNPMVLDRGDGKTHVFFCGLWYADRLVRTPRGWRIRERREIRSYFHNVPDDFKVPD
jgi:hypothetical protein